MFNITEQRLINQQSQIRKKQWLTKLELEEILIRIEDKPYDHVTYDSESEDGLWLLSFNEKGGDVFLKDVILVVEDTANRHENGFSIKEKLQEDEKEMLKNMPEIRKLDRKRLPCLRKVEKGKLPTDVRKVNELLKKIESLKEEQYLYREINQGEIKQATTVTLNVSP